MKSKSNLWLVLVFLIGIFSSVYYVFAANPLQPEPAEGFTIVTSGRYQNDNGTKTITAEAGNVTELLINETRSTEAWQGYVGNITGTITLDDGSNYTLYNWQAATPTGEIYASNTSGPVWTNLQCVNFSANLTRDSIHMNATTLENDFGINVSDKDGFNETFSQIYTCGGGEAPCFKTGSNTIPNNSCHMVTTYVNETSQTTSFKEVLMADNITGALVFVALLENDVDGYKPTMDRHDFQMLVAENGHPGFEASTTPYYFYVELA